MRRPAKDFANDLRRQRLPGRGEESVSVDQVSGEIRRPSMIVPGEGRVVLAPGREHERSASRYAGPMSRHGGA